MIENILDFKFKLFSLISFFSIIAKDIFRKRSSKNFRELPKMKLCVKVKQVGKIIFFLPAFW